MIQLQTRVSATTLTDLNTKAAAVCADFFGTVPHEWFMQYVNAESFDESGMPTRYMADVQATTKT